MFKKYIIREEFNSYQYGISVSYLDNDGNYGDDIKNAVEMSYLGAWWLILSDKYLNKPVYDSFRGSFKYTAISKDMLEIEHVMEE